MPDSACPAFPEAAFLAMWRYAGNGHIQKDDASRGWLERQVRLAMPSSLSLVNDLYYYWASARYGIIKPEDRAYIRRVIYELAEKQLQSGKDLLRVSSSELPYGVSRLVFPSKDDGASEYYGLPHWSWLGSVVLDALRTSPKFARDVGHLILNFRHDGHPGIETYQIDHDLLAGFFGSVAAAAEVIDLIASMKENFTGRDRESIEQLARSAAVS